MFNEFFKGKKILITGHTGFKGSWLSYWLSEILGAEVIGISKDIPTQPSHFEVLKLEKKMKSHIFDILDFEKLNRIIETEKPEILFHLAAQPIVSLSYQDPLNTFATNTLGTINLLESMRRNDSIRRGIFITSDKCYWNNSWEYGYRETDRLGGKDPYSASKACAEIAFEAYFHSYFSHSQQLIATARAGNVIGGGDWAKDRICPDMARAWGEGHSLEIRNPMMTRPWQHVIEALAGYLLLCTKMENTKDSKRFSFNFGPEEANNYSVLDLAKEMVKNWPGAKFHISSNEKSIHEAPLLKLNCDRSRFVLGWRPTLNFEETCQLTSTWYHHFYQRNQMENLTREQILTFGNKAQYISH